MIFSLPLAGPEAKPAEVLGGVIPVKAGSQCCRIITEVTFKGSGEGRSDGATEETRLDS